MGERLTAEERLARVREAGCDRLRVHFTDLLGVSRNKVVPLTQLESRIGTAGVVEVSGSSGERSLTRHEGPLR